MNDLQQLYDDVFKSLPFSITGHFDFESKKNEFYENLSNSNFIRYNSNLTLLFSAVLKLSSKKNGSDSLDELNNHDHLLQDLITWRVSSYDDFYFKALTDGDKDKALSFYFWLLDGYRPTIILSELIIKDIDFRIKMTREYEPVLLFNKRENVLEVSIPMRLFINELTKLENPSLIKQIFNHKFENYSCQKNVEKKEKKQRLYILLDKTKRKFDHYQQLKNEIIDENAEKEIVSSLQEKLNYLHGYASEIVCDNKNFDDGGNENLIYNSFSKCCIALAFVCCYYSSIIEYMLSVAALQFSNEKFIERNLGGLIIGYHKDYKLTSNERAIFNLISDRLTSVIAGNYLYQDIKDLSLGKKRREMKDAFNKFKIEDDIKPDVMHGGNDCSTEFINRKKDLVITNDKWFAKNIFLEFMAKSTNENFMNKYCLVALCKDQNNYKQTNNTFLKDYANIFFEIVNDENVTKGRFNYDFINVPFLATLFAKFLETRTVGEITIHPTIKNLEKKDHSLKLNVEYSPHFDFRNFLNKLIKSEGDLINTYFVMYHELLVTHGNFYMYDEEENEKKLLFDLTNDIEIIDGKVFYLEKFKQRIREHDPLWQVKKIQFCFENKLIEETSK
jgi:hypothetical protein